MALAKRDRQASVALVQQTNVEEDKKSNVEVLDYLQSMNEIIQRDSFPELSKLRTQLEYLDAAEHNDLEKLREISARYQVSHLLSGSSRFGTPANFETPATIHSTPAPSQSIPDTGCRKTIEAVETKNLPSKNKDEPNFALDEFLAKKTSKYNALFEQHREKYQWLYEREKQQIERKEKILALPASEDGDQFKYEDRPATNKNALMYYPDGVDASVQEKIDGKYTKQLQPGTPTTYKTSDTYTRVRETMPLCLYSLCGDTAITSTPGASFKMPEPKKEDNKYGSYICSALEDFKSNNFRTHNSPIEDCSSLFKSKLFSGTPTTYKTSSTYRRVRKTMPLSLYSHFGDTPITSTQDQFGLVPSENISRHQIEVKASASIIVSPNHMHSDKYLDPERKRLALQELVIRKEAEASFPGVLNGFAFIIGGLLIAGVFLITLLLFLCKQISSLLKQKKINTG